MEDPKIEEAKSYTKTELMKLGKPELIAVAGEIGIDLAILPRLTKDSISDAVMVFLEPHLEYEVEETNPVARDDLEEEIIEPRVLEPELATVEDEEVKRDKAIQSAPTYVAIRSCWPSRFVASDSPSGQEYVWEKAGATLQVAMEDVDYIMGKNLVGRRKGCCGSGGDRIYFVLA